MLQTPLFKTLFFLIVIVGFLNLLAVKFYFYWSIWWFDMMMHFLGGAWIAVVALWFFYFSGHFKTKIKTSRAVFIAITSAIIIGVLWEVYELIIGLTLWPEDSFDTITDVVMDTLGAMFSYMYFIYIDKLPKENESQY